MFNKSVAIVIVIVIVNMHNSFMLTNYYIHITNNGMQPKNVFILRIKLGAVDPHYTLSRYSSRRAL